MLHWVKIKHYNENTMSRIGKKIIDIPKDVSITIEKKKIVAKGKHGSLERSFKDFVNFAANESIGTLLI